MAGKVGKTSSVKRTAPVKRSSTAKTSSSKPRTTKPSTSSAPSRAKFVASKPVAKAPTKPAAKSIQRSPAKSKPAGLMQRANDALQSGVSAVKTGAKVAKIGLDVGVDAGVKVAKQGAQAAVTGAKVAKMGLDAGVDAGINAAKTGATVAKIGAQASVKAVQDGIGAAKESIDTVKQLGGIKNAYGVWKAAKPSPEEQRSMEYLHKMLDPNKLGGADRTFNYGDKDAVVNALLKDKNGLKKEVVGKLMAEGKTRQAKLASKAIDGARGVLASVARSKINRDATKEIGGQLEKGLAEARINPNTANTVDDIKRDMTFDDMRTFEQNAAVLKGLQSRISEALGKDIIFPEGISQASLQHSLSGALGLPPGAQIVPQQ